MSSEAKSRLKNALSQKNQGQVSENETESDKHHHYLYGVIIPR